MIFRPNSDFVFKLLVFLKTYSDLRDSVFKIDIFIKKLVTFSFLQPPVCSQIHFKIWAYRITCIWFIRQSILIIRKFCLKEREHVHRERDLVAFDNNPGMGPFISNKTRRSINSPFEKAFYLNFSLLVKSGLLRICFLLCHWLIKVCIVILKLSKVILFEATWNAQKWL